MDDADLQQFLESVHVKLSPVPSDDGHEPDQLTFGPAVRGPVERQMANVGFGSWELNIVVTGVILLFVLLFFPIGIVGSLRQRGRLPDMLDWD